MSTYRFFQDHYIAGLYYSAGTTASTSDVGGTLPFGWIPTPACDPLDTAAVNAFWSAGPKPLIFQFGTLSFQVSSPKTRWQATPVPGNGAMLYSLTGLGSALPAIFA